MKINIKFIIALVLLFPGCATTETSNEEQSASVEINSTSDKKALDKKISVSLRPFPRELRLPNATLVVYQPQLEAWRNHLQLIGWSAVLVKPDDSDNTIVGAIKFSAETDADMTNKTVVAYNRKIIEVSFPSLSSDESEVLKSRIQKVLSKEPELIPLDILLTALSDQNVKHKSVKISVKPPTIFHSDVPAILLLFDGKPTFAQIEKTSLKFAINTNWDVFQDEKASSYYLRHDKQWLVATDYKGPWLKTIKIPKDLSGLPKEDNWKDVLAAIPAKMTKGSMSQVVKVSIDPAELIVTKGKLELKLIGATQLSYVKNTDSDLFFHKKIGHFFYLVSGRWFQASALTGPWKHAKNLPEDFAKIPADHEKSSVRALVPGTVEAKLAVLQANVPRKATVNMSTKGVKVIYSGDPIFEPIHGTSLKYAVNTSFDVIHSSNTYYLCYQGIWFFSPVATGPWSVAQSIPQEIYSIPPDSPVYNVTYVKIYETTKSTVTVGYTSGYHNMYVSYGVVVYGTGYYYSPYYYSYSYYPYYPVYYPHYHSYGVASYYNPNTGTYGRGAGAYGPYGGVGRGASYNPTTGRYSRSAAAWGASDGIYARQSYNPRTGVSTRTNQSINSYSQWGSSVARRGDDWVATSHYRDEKGMRRQFETSTGAKGGQLKNENHSLSVAKNKDGELYVGGDKNVYKRTDDGWLKRDGDDWAQIDKPDTSIDRDAVKDNLSGRDINKGSISGALDNLNNQSITSDPAIDRFSNLRGNSNQSNINQLNRDYRSRSDGNRQYNNNRLPQQGGSMPRVRSAPARGGGGRMRR